MTGTTQSATLTTAINRLLQAQDILQNRVEAALTQNLLDNVGPLGQRRLLPDVSQRLVEVALAYCQHQVDDEELAVHLAELVEMGLRHQAALAVADELVAAAKVVLGHEAEPTIGTRLDAYRQGFLLGYMSATEEYVTREREAVYERMGSALETQVRLERQVRQDLEKLAQELQSVAEISATIASTLDVDQLLDKVTDLAQKQFGHYHAHIYLLDDAGQQLKLVAGSGYVGRAMAAEGRVIALSQPSLVARAARLREGFIVNHVQSDPEFLPHPLLPRTRAEMAVPLLAGDKLLGVLDVQSDQTGTFDEEDLRIHTMLAAQIAVALQNADSFARSEANRRELDVLTRRLTRAGWQEFLHDTPAEELRYAYDLRRLFAPKNGRIVSSANRSSLVKPLIVQGAEIGQLWLEDPQTLTEEAGDIVNAVAERLALHIENLRLAEQTELALAATETQAHRLEMLNVLAGELNSADSSDELFRAVARHTTSILNAACASVTLLREAEQNLELFSLSEVEGAVSTGFVFPLEGSAAGAAIRGTSIVNVSDVNSSNFLEAPNLCRQNRQSSLHVPLATQSGILGTLNVSSQQRNAFKHQDENLLRQIASLFASTLERQKLFEQTELALDETEVLYQASARLNTVQNYDQILDVLREYTIAGQQVNLVSLNLFDHPWTSQYQPEWINVIAYWSDQPVTNETLTYRLKDYPSASRVLLADQPTIINDATSDDRLDSNARALFTRGYKATSVLIVPLVSGGRWRGYISAFYGQQTRFPEQSIRRLTSLASQAAVAIQSLQLLRQTEQQLANLTNIQQTTASLSGALSFKEATDTFLQQVCQAVDADSVDMYQLEGHVVSRIAVYPERAGEPVSLTCTLAEQTMMRWAVETNRPQTLSVNDESLDEELRRSFADAGIETNVTLPLVGRTGTFGILSVNRRQALRQFDKQELNLLQTLSDQAMIAFERVQLLEEATRRAEHEQRLREITTQVRSSIDVDAIMRTAVQEVGRALGRRTLIYLDQDGTKGSQQSDQEVLPA